MCSGACAQAWPPLTTTSTPKAGGKVKASLLGTTKRSDGSREVTYAGHPLYYFAGDSTPGQTTGQGNNGFGSPWWVVSPAGQAIQSALNSTGAGRGCARPRPRAAPRPDPGAASRVTWRQ